MEKPSYFGHRERIKKKFLTEGLKPFLDHEVLELILTYAIPRKDTKKIAWDLMRHFGSLSAVFDASYFELQKIKGFGPQSAMFINIIRELLNRYRLDRIKRGNIISDQVELYDYCRTHLRNKKVEFFEVLFLDSKLHLITSEVISEGEVDKTIVNPRRILELVLKYGAKYIICIHNHPSGDPSPSSEDKIATDELKKLLEPLSAYLSDHIIVGKTRIYSICSQSYIDENGKEDENFEEENDNAYTIIIKPKKK